MSQCGVDVSIKQAYFIAVEGIEKKKHKKFDLLCIFKTIKLMVTEGNPPELPGVGGFDANTDSVVDLKVLFWGIMPFPMEESFLL